MKIIVACFIYPLIKDFLHDFFESIENQTHKQFDLLIFEDGFQADYNSINQSKIIIKNNQNLSIPKARLYVINYAIKNNYELLVFCDADDVMSNDRIEKIVEKHVLFKDKYGFYYNELHLLESGEDLFNGKLPSEITHYSELEDYNFLGMSHTALNLHLTKEILIHMPINDKIIAFDWFLHSYILFKGYSGIKVNTITYYRIYDKNTAGLPDALNETKLKIGIKVKLNHYELMCRIDRSFNDKRAKILQLQAYLDNNQERVQNYIQNVYMNRSNFVFWWQNIFSVEEFKDG